MPVGVTIELGLGLLLVYGIPFIIVVGWFSSRLLGVHRGWGRSLVAGFFGWVGGVAVAAVIENQNIKTGSQLEDVLPLALFFGVLISMFVGLILDVILKPQKGHRHRFRWLLHPIKTAKRRLAPLGRFREMQALDDEVESLQEQLETRRVVDRAKGILMDKHGMTEADSFSFIQKTAMNERRTMRSVADDVVSGQVAPSS